MGRTTEGIWSRLALYTREGRNTEGIWSRLHITHVGEGILKVYGAGLHFTTHGEK